MTGRFDHRVGIQRAVRHSMIAGSIVLASACSVVMERQPHDIIPVEPTSAPISSSVRSNDVSFVYLMPADRTGDHRLVAVPRRVTASAEELLGRLLAGPTPNESRSNGLVSAIPVGTALRSVNVDVDGTLVVQFSDGLARLATDALRDALAQIVLTVTELPTVRRVRVLDGTMSRSWPTDLGSTAAALTARDFPDHLPRSTPAVPTTTAG
jgi:hypothetical protein